MIFQKDLKIKSFLTGSLIAAVTMIIMFAGAEFLVRIIVPWKNDVLHQCNSFYGATGIPNKTGTFYGMRPESMTVPKVVVHMNSKGLRDREYEYENRDSFRIMILGDSMIEALQTPLEQTAQEVLEKLLNNERSDRSNIEVISGAHSGWGTDNEYLFYREEGYKYRPALVLLAFYPWNDIRNNSYELQIAMHEYTTDPYFVLGTDNNIVLKDFPFPCDASSNKNKGWELPSRQDASLVAHGMEFIVIKERRDIDQL